MASPPDVLKTPADPSPAVRPDAICLASSRGLMDLYDHGAQTKIEKIRQLLEQNRAQHRSTDVISKETYTQLAEKLTLESGNDNIYYDLAQNLRKRITDMKIRIDRQMGILRALKDRVKDQLVEMQRLEVDIDIKLRSCKGSCQSYTKYEVDHESYTALEKQINQLDSQSSQTAESVGTLFVMKSRAMKETVVHTVEFILEQEGSISSPATVSKVSVCWRPRRISPDGHGRCGGAAGAPLCADHDWVSTHTHTGSTQSTQSTQTFTY
ncbi:Fibrinogen alpha chain [Liparis tanakae]|uniref:Fibrinogen alpha chain n=1 Tax=Liparis tanakae TaxID=230148 RepID=A0A4Z2EZ53_9TELE|nr:Fibrinogen alpha chain [Liparis tanakae]